MFYRRYRSPSALDEVDRLQREMNRLFSSAQGRRQAAGYPAVNIWSGEEGAILTTEIPGVHVDDLDISVVGDTITLSGSRNAPEIGEDESYHRQERGFGRFSRTMQLPFPVEVQKVDAQYRDGVLKISLPRSEADKPKKISVKNS